MPTQRQEAWKYTGLGAIEKVGVEPPLRPAILAHGPPSLLDGEAHRLVFVDGRFAPALSAVGPLPDGVVLGGLADSLRDRPTLLEPLLGALADPERRAMVALNTEWMADGLVLIVPKGVALDRPIEVTFLASPGEAPHGFSHPRHLIRLGDNAAATLVEHHLGGSAGGFANAVTEVTLGPGAQLRHYVLHSESDTALFTSTLVADIGRDATYRGFTLIAGGALVRHEVEAALTGPGGSCHLDGAYLVAGDRHADTTTLIDHRAPHCMSRQTQKGIVDDRGRAVFQGKILVRPDAQKTDGHQLSQTMLLSPHAEIDVKPELEIYADDVKCSHGATSGRIDRDALFYLRARGIPEDRGARAAHPRLHRRRDRRDRRGGGA